MIKFLIISLLIINTNFQPIQNRPPKVQQSNQTAAISLIDYEIYSSLLDNIISPNKTKSIFILDETIASTATDFNVDEHYNFLKSKLPTLNKDTLISFDENNK